MAQSTKKDFCIIYSFDDKDAGRWFAYQINRMGYTVSAQTIELLKHKTILQSLDEAKSYFNYIIFIISSESSKAIFSDNEIKKMYTWGITDLENILFFIGINGYVGSEEINAHFCYTSIPLGMDEDCAAKQLHEFILKSQKQPIAPSFYQGTKIVLHHIPIGEKMKNSDVISLRKREYKNILDNTLLKGNYHMKLKLEEEFTEIKEEIKIYKQKKKIKKTEKEKEELLETDKKKSYIWKKISEYSILSEQENYVLINASGMGKTTFLNYLCWLFLENYEEYKLLPLYKSCLEINRRGIADISVYFENEVFKIYGDSEILHKDWSNLYIFLDALDQSYDINEIVELLKDSKSFIKAAKIIITTRENTASKVPDIYRKLCLQLPQKNEITKYLGINYDSVLPVLQSSCDIVSIPVLLEMINILAKNGELLENILNRADIYTKFINHMLNIEREKPRYFQDTEDIKRFLNNDLVSTLANIAFNALNTNNILVIDKESLLQCGISEAKRQALLRTGLIQEFFENNPSQIVFRHQSFQAYFAARFMLNRPEMIKQIAGNLAYFYHDVWSEVLRFYLNMEEDTDKIDNFVDEMIKQKDNNEILNSVKTIQTAILLSQTKQVHDASIGVLEKTFSIIKTTPNYIGYLESLLDSYNLGNKLYKKAFINYLISPICMNVKLDINTYNEIKNIIRKIGNAEDVDLIITLFSMPLGIKKTLSRNGEKEIDTLIAELLRDEDFFIRSYTLEVIGELRAYKYINLLLPMLRDENMVIRIEARDTIVKLCTLNNIDLFIPLLKDECWFIRLSAVMAIRKNGISEHADLLIPLLQDNDWCVRREVVGAFVTIGTYRHINSLIKLLRDEDWMVRHATAEAIKKISTLNNINILISLLQDTDLFIRKTAIAVLGEIATFNHINLIIPFLEDEAWEVRKTVVEVIRRIGAFDHIQLLIPLLKDKNLDVRSAVEQAIKERGNPELVDSLFPLLKDKNRLIRNLNRIRETRDLDNVKLVVKSMKNRDLDICIAAIKAIGEIGTSEHLNLLIPLINEWYSNVSNAAREALVNIISSTGNINLAIRMLNFTNESLRIMSVESISKMGVADYLELIIPLLNDKSEAVQFAVIKAISEMGNSDNIKLLIPFINSQMNNAISAIKVLSNSIKESLKVEITEKRGIQFSSLNKESLNILHISDIHFSQRDNWDFDSLFEKFSKTLQLWIENRKEQIDIICITGDIVFCGEEKQFECMEQVIDKILRTTGCDNSRLFIVPGNHDLQNYEEDHNEMFFKEIYENDHEPNKTFLNEYKNYKPFLDKLENYERFLISLKCKNSFWHVSRNEELKPWFVYQDQKKPLIIIGLSSPIFIRKKYHMHGQVKMGIRQFKEACISIKKDPNWNNQQIIVLTHHPLDWLSMKEMNEYEEELLDYRTIHLMGHSHFKKNVEIRDCSGRRRLSFQAGCLYGDEGTEYKNCFEIISIDFNKKEALVSQFVWDENDWRDDFNYKVNPYRLPISNEI